MRILSPRGEKIDLDVSLDLKERVIEIEKLVDQYETDIQNNWDSNKVKFFLDGLANYLVWYKDEEMKNKEDKEILSGNKLKKLSRFNDQTTPFSSLSKEDAIGIGLDVESDDF